MGFLVLVRGLDSCSDILALIPNFSKIIVEEQDMEDLKPLQEGVPSRIWFVPSCFSYCGFNVVGEQECAQGCLYWSCLFD